MVVRFTSLYTPVSKKSGREPCVHPVQWQLPSPVPPLWKVPAQAGMSKTLHVCSSHMPGDATEGSQGGVDALKQWDVWPSTVIPVWLCGSATSSFEKVNPADFVISRWIWATYPLSQVQTLCLSSHTPLCTQRTPALCGCSHPQNPDPALQCSLPTLCHGASTLLCISFILEIFPVEQNFHNGFVVRLWGYNFIKDENAQAPP